MNSVYKYCIVPCCSNTTVNTPDKLFLSVPKDSRKRKAWTLAMRRDDRKNPKLSHKTSLYCCEDHFSLQEDLQNFWQWRLMSDVKRLELKPGILPHRFECQKPSVSLPPERQAAKKPKRHPKKFYLKKNAVPSKCLPVSSVSVVPSKKQLEQKKKREERCNMKKKYTKISLFPSTIKVEIDESPTEPNNSLSFEDSNGDVSLEQERTERTAAEDLGEKNSQPLPSLVSVQKATLTFAEVLDVLYRQHRISEPAKNKLKMVLPKGEDSAHVIEPTAEGQKRQYSTELRNFALSFYFYSFSAYVYAWRNYDTFLPPPSALRKGYEISCVKSEHM